MLIKLAAARRLVDFSSNDDAIAVCRDGRLKYWIKKPNFPRISIGQGDPLPTMPPFANYGISEVQLDDANAWLMLPAMDSVSVQTLYQQDGYSMTLVKLA